MKVMFYKIFWILTLTRIFISIVAADPVAKSSVMALVIKEDHIRLTSRKMTLCTYPDSLRFSLSSPYGKFVSDLRGATDIKLKNIDVQVNTSSEKRVVLTTKPLRWKDDNYVYNLTLSANIELPGINIEIALQNVGKYPALTYFYFKLIPIHSGFYFDADGEQSAAKSNIPLKRWLFLPINNSVGGYGVIFHEIETFNFTTLYPRSDWRKTGWYFIPRKKRFFKPDYERRIAFRIFPVKNWDGVSAAFKFKVYRQNKLVK